MSSGRPRATSQATIAEAATELFLEQGYAETTVADITRRAGVSRSSFFNYFGSKSAILWAGLDEGIAAGVTALQQGAPVGSALRRVVDELQPDALALGILHGAAMGIADDLAEERAIRTGMLARALADHYLAAGETQLASDVRGAREAGAVLAAVWAWAVSGPPRSPLGDLVDEAFTLADLDR
ncbi:TetR/AcrR family transcriptional regulator [Microbacterium sp. VKM Ac-2870]|uniref:TetR/AcrR family transcriptional regulator n=1 Tax=Microbacterium sp. VKM Ac-2870 TaxID=2783825 RepID=UPI001E529D4F|nr:TetR/AcrR family transcriptional regulator [Microbacterium sp. VKM Ac-2870]